MNVQSVQHRDDPRVTDYLDLTDTAGRRRREGDEFFIAEGPTAIERLLTSDHRVRSVLVAENKLSRLAPVLDGLDAPVFVAPREVLAEVVGFDLHRGAVASADRRPLASIEELAARSTRLAVLEGLNDPENLGAISRSARAFGIDGLVLDPTCIDPYYRRTVRVSMGEVLHLDVARARRWPDDLDLLHDAGFETWAMSPAAEGDDLWDLAPPERTAIVLGAEGPGLAERTIERATRRVRIPIVAGVDSLNVGSAAAVTFAVCNRPPPR
ncbi:MAG: RNA methyltransferase [Ilumatobacter sp.]|nr:MAG: RNA methyltransferase [Ilumatobacter sp.]